MSGRWFPWHPKGGCTPPINLEVFFSDILATATRLNTLYGLETWYVQSPRRVLITKKVLRHIRHFWRIYDVINVGFFRHFAVFGYSKCHKVCRNSWFSHRICILIGSTTLPSLMCNRLCVVELWRHNGRKSAIFSTRPIHSDGLLIQHVLLLRSSWNFTSRYALERAVNWQSLKMTSSILTEL